MIDLSPFPRHALTFGPTPIEPLPRLAAHLSTKGGRRIAVWAKRDDCNSGLGCGGNKLRKLEYLVPEALAQGADTLVSIGGVQSNHTRQVAAVAAKLGMKCLLVQGSWVVWPDVTYDRVGNLLLSRMMGAELAFSKEDLSIAVGKSFDEALARVRQRGGRPYAIPVGASDHPLGGLGYVGFANEVMAQEAALGVRFDPIVVASASGSTQAGMIVGFLAEKRPRRVLGIDVTGEPAATRAQILRIAQATAAKVGLGRAITIDDVELDESSAHPAYGVPSEGTLAAMRLAARLEGLVTDPVYEGKSMQALVEKAAAGHFAEGAHILYVHLGGVPALHAYGYPFRDG
jgi:1-aminocyclopropane-1-carboxylate deaminase